MKMKSQNKSLIMYSLVAALGIGFLPAVNLLKRPKELNVEVLYNTDFIESHVNFLAFKIFGKSTNPANVIVGKQGDLFLGNMHNKLLYKTMDIYPYSDVQIDHWSKNLVHLQQWYEYQGIEFILVLAPNKHSIYAENLPHWVQPAEYNLTDKLINASKKLGAHIVDLRPILLESKHDYDELLYWKTDSHWNQLGATIGFKASLEALSSFYQQSLVFPKYQFGSKAIQANGGHAKFLKIQNLLPMGYETLVYRETENESEVCAGNIDPQSFQLQPCTMKLRPYLDIHRGPVYTVNEKALNPEGVLILADSFLMQNSSLYDHTFNKTWKLKYNHLTGDRLQKFIDIQQPDVVVYQVVERSLFNNYFIDINSSQVE